MRESKPVKLRNGAVWVGLLGWALAACAPTADPDARSWVRVEVGALGDADAAGLLPAAGAGFAERGIVAVRMRVRGEGFEAIRVDVPASGVVEIEVPAGPARRFEVEALGAMPGSGGLQIYAGASLADLSGSRADVRVLLSPAARSRSLSGEVRDVAGEPAAFARLAVAVPELGRLRPWLDLQRAGGTIPGAAGSAEPLAGLGLVAADGPLSRAPGRFVVEAPESSLFEFRLRAYDLAGVATVEAPLQNDAVLRLAAASAASLPQTARLTLQARTVSGQPVTDAVLVLARGGTALLAAAVDEGDQRVLANLEPGNARVLAWRGGRMEAVTETVVELAADRAATLDLVFPDPTPVDTTPPQTTILTGPPTPTNQSSASFTFSADEPATFECRLDGGAWAVCSSPRSFSGLADGTHVFEVRAIDLAGNLGAEITTSWLVDTTPPFPVSMLIADGASQVTATTVNLALGTADAVTYDLSGDLTDPRSGESVVTQTTANLTPGAGLKTLTATFYDALGNASVVTESVELVVDGPVGGVTAAVLLGNSELRDVFPDVSGSNQPFEMRVDGDISDGFAGTWQAHAGLLGVSLTPGDGEKMVTVRFRDSLQLESPIYGLTLTLDTLPPDCATCITIDVPTPPWTNDVLTAIQLDATDANGPLEMSIAGDILAPTGWIAFAADWMVELSAGDGEKTVTVEYRDGAGNVAGPFQDMVLLDQTPPEILLFAITGSPVAVSDPTLSLDLDVTDFGVLEMQISEDPGFGGAVWESYSTSVGFVLPPGDGMRTVYARFRDEAGNLSAVTDTSVVLDTTPPEVFVVELAAGAASVSEPTVDLFVDASADAYEMRVTGDTVAGDSGWIAFVTATTVDLLGGDGEKWVWVTVRDLAGNVSLPQGDSVLLGEGGLIGLLGVAQALTNQTLLDLALTADSVHTPIEMFLSGDILGEHAWRLFEPAVTVELNGADGSKLVSLELRDAASNTFGPVTETVLLDTEGPSGFISTASYFLTSETFWVELAASDNLFGSAELEVELSGADLDTPTGWQPLTTPVQVTLFPGDGTRAVQARFRDPAGNIGPVTQVEVRVDTVAPTVAVTDPADGALFAAFPLLSGTASDAGSGVSAVTLSVFDGSFYWDGAGFGSLVEWTFPAAGTEAWTAADLLGASGVDALYLVTVYAVDLAGNMAWADSTFELDQTAPDCIVCIALDVPTYPWTNTLEIGALLDASDMNYFEMRFSGDVTDPTPTDWVVYSSTEAIWLTPGDGTKTVFVEYRDEAGNLSGPFSDSVTLDTVPPADVTAQVAGGASAVSSTTVSVEVWSSEAVRFDLTGPDLVSEIFAFPLVAGYAATDATFTAGDGPRAVTVTAADAAGNVTDLVLWVDLDTTGPDVDIRAPFMTLVTDFALAWQAKGNASGDWFGGSVAAVGDLDGDGVPDLVVGAPNTSVGGSIYALSGTDGSLLYSVDGEAAGHEFGYAIAALGDIDGDGVPDYLVGADTAGFAGTDSGSVYLLSGADGSVIYRLDGEGAGHLFGIDVAGLGDVDGDGVPDFAVGAMLAAFGGANSGSAYVFSGATGNLLYRLDGEAASHLLGISVAGIPDLDGDGIPDLLVGANLTDFGGTNAGSVYVFSGADGTLIRRIDGEATEVRLGFSVDYIRGLEPDDVPSIVSGANKASFGGTDSGSVYVLSGIDGSVLYRVDGEAAGDEFGTSVAVIGDVDEDGIPEFLVGAYRSDVGGLDSGSVYVLSGADGTLIRRLEGFAAGDAFGWSVARLGDRSGDGIESFAIGAYLAAPEGIDTGALYVATPFGPVRDWSPLTTATFRLHPDADTVTMRARLDGAAWESATDPTDFDGIRFADLGEGTRLLEVQAADALGNWGTTATFSWGVDLTPPPAPGVSLPFAGSATSATVSVLFSGTATDPVISGAGGTVRELAWHLVRYDGVETWFWDGSAFAGLDPEANTFSEPITTAWTLPVPVDDEAQYTWVGAVIDGAFQTGATTTVQFVVDRTPPTASVTSPVYYTSSLLVEAQVTAFDEHGPLEMRFLGDLVSPSPGAWLPLTTSTMLELPAGEGFRNVTAEVRDAAGNVTNAGSLAFGVDQTPADVFVDFPAPGFLSNVGPSDIFGTAAKSGPVASPLTAVVVTIFDGLYYYDEFGLGSLAPVTVPVTGLESWSAMLSWSSVPEGVYSVEVEVLDAAGLSGFGYTDFEIDQTPPSCDVCIELQPAGPVNTPNVTLASAGVMDPNGPVLMRVAGDLDDVFVGDWIAYDPFLAITLSLGSGVKWVFVEYMDGAGNIAGPFSDSIELDEIPPFVDRLLGVSVAGLYGEGGIIEFDLQFSEDVVLTLAMPPVLTLNSGGTAEYVSQAGPDTLRMRYEVGPGEEAAWLDAMNAGALDLNGSTLTDLAGNAADLMVPLQGSGAGLADDVTYAVDGVPPLLAQVELAGGASSVTEPLVDLFVDASGDPFHMRVTGDTVSGDSGWIAYISLSQIELLGGTGLRTVWVQVRDEAGNLSAELSGSVTLDEVPVAPTAPTELVAKTLSATSAELRWKDASENEDGFRIERSDNGGAFTEVQTVGADVTAWTDSGLATNAAYAWRVLAYNVAGDSAYSNIATAYTFEAVQVAAGSRHTCALTTAGGVLCWGDNSRGQLGDGSFEPRSGPVPVSGLASGVASIAAGFRFNCARDNFGEVLCWGENTYGQLGDGSFFDRSEPVLATSWTEEVVVGDHHACARDEFGGVLCWGRNHLGQLGDGTGSDSATAVVVDGLTGVASLGSGASHTCARLDAGGAKCWGANHSGQLGDGSQSDRWTPVDVAGQANDFLDLAAGWGHTCARTVSGEVRCWGNNWQGQLGDGSDEMRLTPVTVATLPGGIQAIAAGTTHTCAVDAGDALHCWGDNQFGQLGDGTTGGRWLPARVKGVPAGVASVSASDHSCVALGSGSMQCWGDSADGRLGTKLPLSQLVPQTPDPLLERMVAVAAGQHHSCGLDSDGYISCWGRNDQGQLNVSEDVWLQVVSGDSHACGLRAADRGVSCWGDDSSGQATSAPTGGFLSLGSGSAHVCGIRPDWSVVCWGNDSNGQASGVVAGTYQFVDGGASHSCGIQTDGTLACWGDGTSGKTTPPSGTFKQLAVGGGHACAINAIDEIECWGEGLSGQTTPPGGTFVEISVDGSFSCARTAGNAVSCWGDNSDGQTAAPGDAFTRIAAGAWHACGVRENGSALCWGWNDFGQASAPVPPTVQKLATGAEHSCLLTDQGGVRCWGANTYAQLGDGTLDSRSTARYVSGLRSGVDDLALGATHACVLTTAGGVRCWGDNSWGQLGDGSMEPSPPVDVSGLTSGVVEIAAGNNHACARLSDNSLVCWGQGEYGQLGDGFASTVSEPVVVSSVTVVRVAAGDRHTCAILDDVDSRVYCWGANSYGQLGDLSITQRNTPVPVDGGTSGFAWLQDATDLALGREHSCANTLWGLFCWGSNEYGQVGDGGGVDRDSPEFIDTASTVGLLSAGDLHTCATVSTGLLCWGSNVSGELGIGSTEGRSEPAVVPRFDDGADLSSLALGGSQSMLRHAQDGVLVWGNNYEGQLGLNRGWLPAPVRWFLPLP